MMKLARTIRLDESDDNVFRQAASSGEWAISGGFAFSNLSEDDLSGKTRQEFANGWLSLDSFGRATFAAVTVITEQEFQELIDRLAAHFVEYYGAPNIDAARPVAAEELEQMRAMCEDHDDNTIVMISRSLTDTGIHESYRFSAPQGASLDTFAVHGSVD